MDSITQNFSFLSYAKNYIEQTISNIYSSLSKVHSAVICYQCFELDPKNPIKMTIKDEAEKHMNYFTLMCENKTHIGKIYKEGINYIENLNEAKSKFNKEIIDYIINSKNVCHGICLGNELFWIKCNESNEKSEEDVIESINNIYVQLNKYICSNIIINQNNSSISLSKNNNTSEKYSISFSNNYLTLIYETKEENENVPLVCRSKTRNNRQEDNFNVLIDEPNEEAEQELKNKYEFKFMHPGSHKVTIIFNDERINLREFFYGCDKLTEVIDSDFETCKVEEFSYMFKLCKKLHNINGLSKFKVSDSKSFKQMFCDCKNISDLSPLKEWDVSKATDFSGMFANCSNIKSLECLRKWNTKSGEDFSDMFNRCVNLTSINPVNNWDMINENNLLQMFKNCKILKDLPTLEK